jgi:hypothetical protein
MMSMFAIWLTPRIWFDEVERIGMHRCTPFGYALNVLGGLLWFLGILLIPGMPAYLVFLWFIAGTFPWPLLWMLAIPFRIIILGSVLIAMSWLLAGLKNFRYDGERRESSWIDGGQNRSFTYSDWQAAEGRHAG